MQTPALAPAGRRDAVAATDGTTTLTYAELTTRAGALAARMIAAGLRPGDRIATLSANSLDQVVLFYACIEAHLVLVPLSWRATADELAVMVGDAEPVLLATDPGHQGLAAHAAAQLDSPPTPVLLGPGGLEHEVPAQSSAEMVAPATTSALDPDDDPVLLLFTSGSSGRPKGVVLSRASCAATNAALASRFPITADDTVLLVLPQFHVAGWNVQPLLAWSVGARVVVVPAFDAAAVLDTLERERVTVMMGVPTTYELLAARPDFAARDLTALHTAVVGGAPVDELLGGSWAQHGVRLWAGYGLTEAGPNVLCEPASATGPTGWLEPYDGVEVRLDRDGQLLVRSPGVFTGYWRDPDATVRVLVDGWLATGDVADERAGRFRLRGRNSEKYISGGENVHPAEVEHALRLLPSVAEAAVVGVPDERWGEAGVAFVVPPAGQAPTGDQIRQDVRAHLAGFKVPRDVVVIAALPQTGTGKIDKRSLRDQAKEQG